MSTNATTRAALFLSCLCGAAVAAAQSNSAHPLFADQTPLEIKISAPFSQLWRERDERVEHDGVFEYSDANGESVAIDIEVRLRGRSRRMYCDFPPLSLDFPRGEVGDTLFSGQNRLKLVTMCRRSTFYQDYLVQEFLIYRMLNELTERSFRVRWANVEYVPTDTKRERSVITPAFLIEADWEVAERLGMELVEVLEIEEEQLDIEHTALISLFQYLIGNTDWSVKDAAEDEPCCHNGKVLRSSSGDLLVLPYDFDASGLIDAEYAAPAENLPISAVTQRLYRGFCRMQPEVDRVIAALNAKRDLFIGLFDREDLSNSGRKRAVNFLEDSFEVFNDQDKRETRIDAVCRD